jgi:hypothetical protein
MSWSEVFVKDIVQDWSCSRHGGGDGLRKESNSSSRVMRESGI